MSDGGGHSAVAHEDSGEKRGTVSTSRTTVWLVLSLIFLLAMAGLSLYKDYSDYLRQELASSRNLADVVQVDVTETLNQTAVGLRAIERDMSARDGLSVAKRLVVLQTAMRYDPNSWVLGFHNANGTVMVDTDGAELKMPELLKEVDAALASGPNDGELALLPAIYSKEYLDWYLPVKLTRRREDGQMETAFALVAATKLIRTASIARVPVGSFFVFATTDGRRLFRYLVAEQEIQVSSSPLTTVSQSIYRQVGVGILKRPG